MRKLLLLGAMLASACALSSCDLLNKDRDFTSSLGNGGRNQDVPYVDDIVSLEKVYSFKANSDLLSVASLTLSYVDKDGNVVKKKITGTDKVTQREKVQMKVGTKACKLTEEETSLASSVIVEPNQNSYNGQYIFEYEYQMYYVATRENGETIEIPAVNICPQCPAVDGADVSNELHAIGLGCTKDKNFDQTTGYVSNGDFWVSNNYGYLSNNYIISTDGMRQDDPTTQPSRRAGHDYVDLGLSVYWATTNVGAQKEEQYGGVYGWADASGYHTESNYKFYPCSRPSVKDISGTRMDIAYCQWGREWRMPTTVELGELFDRQNCKWEWTDSYRDSGIKGYVVTSLKKGYEGNYIFMPAGGKRQYEEYYQLQGMHGYYWSSELYNGDNQFAYIAYFTNRDNLYPKFHLERYNGAAVRPVTDK